MSETQGSAASQLAGNPGAAAGADGKAGEAGGAAAHAAWFGEANKGFVETKGWKSGDDAIASYVGLEKLLGADKAGRGVVIPKDETDEAGWNQVFGKLGRPDKPDGYKVPDSLKEDPLVGDFNTEAHKLGLSAKQYDGVMKFVNDRVAARATSDEAAQTAAFEKAQLELKREWGNAHDGNMELARRAVRQFGVSEETLAKMEAGMGPAGLLRLFHQIGSKLGEDSAGTTGSTAGGALSPSAAKQKQTEMWNDSATQAILRDKMHPQHAEVQARWEALGKQIVAGA